MKKLFTLGAGFLLAFAFISVASAKSISLETIDFKELKTFTPSNTTCTVDFIKDSNTCKDIVKTISRSKGTEMVLELNLEPVDGVPQRAIFDVNFQGEPADWFKDSDQAWTVNIGDSSTNNGRAGDAATQSNDSELQVMNDSISVYASDYGNSERMYYRTGVFNNYNQTSNGYKLTFGVSNNKVSIRPSKYDGLEDMFTSSYLFALDGQDDDEGEINYNIYAAFNRVIANNNRNGDGVSSVTITIEDDVMSADLPDLLQTDINLAYGYGYGYKKVTKEENIAMSKGAYGYGYGYGVVQQYQDLVTFKSTILNFGMGNSLPTQVQCFNDGGELVTTQRGSAFTNSIPSFTYTQFTFKLSNFGLSNLVSTPGMKEIWCEVDSDYNIEESNENNNIRSYQFYVQEVNTNYAPEQIAAYNWAYNNGFVAIPNIDDANLFGYVSRAVAARYLSKFAIEFAGLEPDTSIVCDFDDIQNPELWYYNDVISACQLGLIGVDSNGNPDVNYYPEEVINRGDFMTALSRIIWGDEYNGDTNPEYIAHMEALQNAGVISTLEGADDDMLRVYTWMFMKRVDDADLVSGDICNEPMTELNCVLGLEECPAECMSINFDENDVSASIYAGQEDVVVADLEIDSYGPVFVDEIILEQVGLYTEGFETLTMYDDSNDVVGICNININDECLMDIIGSLNGHYTIKTDIPNTVIVGDSIGIRVTEATAEHSYTQETIEDVTGLPTLASMMSIIINKKILPAFQSRKLAR